MPLFDAVAYVMATAKAAREYCKCLPDDEKIRRKRRFGWRRYSINKPFDGFMMGPDIHGSAELTPDDFEWRELGEWLSGGTIKAEALKRIEPNAIIEREMELKELAADDNTKTEKRETAKARMEQWNDSCTQARALYLYAVADMAHVKDPENLSIERLMAIKAAADIPIIEENAFIAKLCGSPPEPDKNDDGIEDIPDEIKNDFDAYVNLVYSAYVKRPIEKTVKV